MALQNVTDAFTLVQSAGDIYRGDEGDQNYIITPNLVEAGATIQIGDLGGNNTIELAGGLEITSTVITSNEAQLTLSNGAVVNVRGADTFNFATGANSAANQAGVVKDFATFAQEDLGLTVPAEGETAEAGTVTVNEDGTVTGGGDGGNGGDNTFSLTDAISAANTDEGLPAEYELSDAELTLDAAVTVEGLATEQTAAQAIIDGATNAADLTLATTYTLEDTLANVAAAEDGVVANAGSYTLTNEAGDLGELTEAEQALVEGAENAGDYEFAPEGAGLTQALTDLQTANAGVATAAEALNDAAEDNDALTAGYAASAEGVTAARADAQAAVDAAQADLTAELETTVADTTGGLNDATSKHLGSTQALTEANLNTAKAGVQGEIDSDETVFFKNEDGTLRDFSSEATFDLNNAEEGASDQVLDLSDAAKESGNVKVDLAELSEGNKDGNNGGGADTIVLPKLADVTGTVTINNMNLGEDSVVLDGLEGAEVTVKGSSTPNTSESDQGIYPYLDVNVGGDETNGVNFNNLVSSNALLLKLVEDGTLTVKDADDNVVSATDFEAALKAPVKSAGTGPGFDNGVNYKINGVDVFKSDNNDNNDTEGVDALFTVVPNGAKVPFATIDDTQLSTVLEGVSIADILGDSLIAEADVDAGLEDVGFTLSDLQDAAQDAAAELDTARAVESDADLLSDVAGAISAHIGAGGSDVDADDEDGNDLLTLRSTINTALNGDDDVVISGDRISFSSEDLLAALAGKGSVNDNGVVTFEAATAPETGEGSWIKGQETGDATGQFTYTYEPSAEEQALVGAVADVEGRADLIEAEFATETAFNNANTTGTEGTTLGAQLDAIDGQLKALADTEKALDDAQADQTAAEEVIGGLEAAVAEQDAAEQWFEDNGFELPVTAEGNVAGTADNDIFLFDEDASANAAIGNFGAAGEDQLFFGEGFELVALQDGESITDQVGDVATQEIFWEQNGNNVELFVENEAFAGNGSSDADLTQVTLTGVTGEDLQDNLASGTLTAGTAADIA